ncbi:MAG TPA: endonuclease/exonuclease/phosphatase family protein [Candidatus Acidoferrum sp.]|jgi:endonuclease/exonuclease/phosphatase family metal-dependent hydrolase|nr:endonuclease/exonuclease/phosphatase family protein [Candidatus Acidoferrum sp.]
MPYVTMSKFATLRVLAVSLSSFVNLLPFDVASFAISLPQPSDRPNFLEMAVGLRSVQTLSGSKAVDESPQTARLTVTSYNIHSCEGLDLRVKCDRIAEILTRTHADIIGLQEVRAGQEQEIARILGFHALFARADHVGGYEFGNAILSRFPIRRSDVYLLGVPHHEQRVCLHAEIAWPGESDAIHVFSAHLGQNETERQQQAQLLASKSILENPSFHNAPRVLLGDFNEKSRNGVVNQTLAKFQCATGKSWTVFFPIVYLDRIYISSDLKFHDFHIYRTGSAVIASDHAAITAVLLKATYTH